MMSSPQASPPLMGMYVHQHWGYRHPYSARTWTLEDWRGYARGLTALGYNAMMIWPMLEIIPDPLTESDRAHLEKMRAVIDLLHREFAMTVFITMGPNVIGNEHAAQYAFPDARISAADRRLNPAVRESHGDTTSASAARSSANIWPPPMALSLSTATRAAISAQRTPNSCRSCGSASAHSLRRSVRRRICITGCGSA